MLFNSLQFLVFFSLVTALYFALPWRRRWPLLLAASYYFYMCWRLEYVILIIASTLLNYVAARKMEHAGTARVRAFFLTLSIGTNLGILFAFKYFNFISDSFRAVLAQANIFYDTPAFSLLLPVGISFYTFQTMSYTIDVYRGARQAERHLGIFALYVAFFPQLVAGPIERSTRLLPQFHEEKRFDYQRVTDGLKLMAWGFFKKLVIADRLAMYVDQVYGHPGDYQNLAVLMATYFFAFQIYCDFSGYSDIAIGAARIMGYRLMKNFNQPYFATSIADFWRRWHISLSTWFRDYLYFPLGGSRLGRGRWIVNILAVFLLSGLWHGANWTFAAWGLLHGITYLASSLFPAPGVPDGEAPPKTLGTAGKLLRIALTFHVVVLAWVFFRADSIAEAFVLLSGLCSFDGFDIRRPGVVLSAFGPAHFAISLVAIGVMIFVEWVHARASVPAMLSRTPPVLRWAAYHALVASIFLFGVFGSKEFIYFQF